MLSVATIPGSDVSNYCDQVQPLICIHLSQIFNVVATAMSVQYVIQMEFGRKGEN